MTFSMGTVRSLGPGTLVRSLSIRGVRSLGTLVLVSWYGWYGTVGMVRWVRWYGTVGGMVR